MYKLNVIRNDTPLLVVVGLVLSGCGHTTASEVAKDIAGIVLVETGKHKYVQNCSPEGKFEGDCKSESETMEKLGRSIYSEIVNAESAPSSEELPEELDDFIERRRVPAGYSEGDADEVPRR